jgi:hypothetical protein
MDTSSPAYTGSPQVYLGRCVTITNVTIAPVAAGVNPREEEEAASRWPAVDLGGRVWLGDRPCKGGPAAHAMPTPAYSVLLGLTCSPISLQS